MKGLISFLTSSEKSKEGRNWIFKKFMNPRTYDLGKQGRLNFNRKLGLAISSNQTTLTAQDVLSATDYLLKLEKGLKKIDDIDHLKNRRVRTAGELLQIQIGIGLIRLEKMIREKLAFKIKIDSQIRKAKTAVSASFASGVEANLSFAGWEVAAQVSRKQEAEPAKLATLPKEAGATIHEKVGKEKLVTLGSSGPCYLSDFIANQNKEVKSPKISFAKLLASSGGVSFPPSFELLPAFSLRIAKISFKGSSKPSEASFGPPPKGGVGPAKLPNLIREAWRVSANGQKLAEGRREKVSKHADDKVQTLSTSSLVNPLIRLSHRGAVLRPSGLANLIREATNKDGRSMAGMANLIREATNKGGRSMTGLAQIKLAGEAVDKAKLMLPLLNRAGLSVAAARASSSGIIQKHWAVGGEAQAVASLAGEALPKLPHARSEARSGQNSKAARLPFLNLKKGSMLDLLDRRAKNKSYYFGQPLILFSKAIFKGFASSQLSLKQSRSSEAIPATNLSKSKDSDFAKPVLNNMISFFNTKPFNGALREFFGSCLTPDHNVLTDKGFIPIQKVTLEHKVATLKNNEELVYVHPTKVHKYDHDGQVYEVDVPGVSLKTTLNHRMYVQLHTDKEIQERPAALQHGLFFIKSCRVLRTLSFAGPRYAHLALFNLGRSQQGTILIGKLPCVGEAQTYGQTGFAGPLRLSAKLKPTATKKVAGFDLELALLKGRTAKTVGRGLASQTSKASRSRRSCGSKSTFGYQYALIPVSDLLNKKVCYKKDALWTTSDYQFILPGIPSQSPKEKTDWLRGLCSNACFDVHSRSHNNLPYLFLGPNLHTCHPMPIKSKKTGCSEAREPNSVKKPDTCSSIPEKRMPMDAWLVFMGFFISKGWAVNHDLKSLNSDVEYKVVLSLKKPVIEKNLAELNLEYYKTLDATGCFNYCIFNKQLWAYLRTYSTGALHKTLPEWVWKLSKRQCNILLDALIAGNGTTLSKTKSSRRYCSSSLKLINDVSRLILHAGYAASRIISENRPKNMISNKKLLLSTNTAWSVNILSNNKAAFLHTLADYASLPSFGLKSCGSIIEVKWRKDRGASAIPLGKKAKLTLPPFKINKTARNALRRSLLTILPCLFLGFKLRSSGSFWPIKSSSPANLRAFAAKLLPTDHEARAPFKYLVAIRKQRPFFSLGLNRVKDKLVHYKGPVYCLTVPNEVFYVERNGKGVWTGNSQLSQFMDQLNPLAEITHKRRLSSMGPGGVTRDSATLAIRGIHPTHYGRICPIETPEGKNTGLVNSLTTYARANAQGFLESPFFKVYKGQIQKNAGIYYLSAEQEENIKVAAADVSSLSGRIGFLPKSKIPAKIVYGDTITKISRNLVQYIGVSPIQMISIATSLIPFLEHDDANRALMGSNMQRQAVPLIRAERPLVGTGLESRTVSDSGHSVVAKESGYVAYVSAKKIVIYTIPN